MAVASPEYELPSETTTIQWGVKVGEEHGDAAHYVGVFEVNDHERDLTS